MSPTTAEQALADAASERRTTTADGPVPTPAAGPARRLAARLAAPLARLRADPARMLAVADSWRALWSSRLLAWSAGLAAVGVFGFGPTRSVFNPPGLTGGFGWLGNLLVAPVARWDSSWFLAVARYGYQPDLAPFTNARAAYFPLYPLGVRALGWLGPPLVLAGVLLSVVAFAAGLYGIHRLTTLELTATGGRASIGGLMRVRTSARGARAERAALDPAAVARLAVLVTAFSPMAFYFSAVYSESLFLALTVGAFWSARSGRWAWAGVLGALACATRSTGLALLAPALLLYLYGPRADRPPDRPGTPPAPGAREPGLRGIARRLQPRYRLRPDVLWLALMPAGVLAFCAWLAATGGDFLGPFHAAQAWYHHLVVPFGGVWDGLVAGFDGARQLLSFQRAHVYFALAGGNPYIVAWHNLMELGFLLAGLAITVGVLRRLPLAYGAYVLAALALPLTYPVTPQPLMSIPRYEVVLFPLAIWLAMWLAEHPRAQRPALVLSVALMVLFVAQFATWHWVA